MTYPVANSILMDSSSPIGRATKSKLKAAHSSSLRLLDLEIVDGYIIRVGDVNRDCLLDTHSSIVGNRYPA